MKDIFEGINDFLGETRLSQAVPYLERKRIAQSLLRQAEVAFRMASGERELLLGQGIDKLRRILSHYEREDVAYKRPVGWRSLRAKQFGEASVWLAACPGSKLSVMDKWTKTKGYLLRLQNAVVSPTKEEAEIMERLQGLMNALEMRKPLPQYVEPEPERWNLPQPDGSFRHENVGPISVQRLGQPAVGKPPILAQAESFFRSMENKKILDRTSLNSAIAQGQGYFNRLNSTLDSLSINDYRRWAPLLLGEKRGIGELITRWKSQLKEMDKVEAVQRTESLEQVKRQEDTAVYVGKKDRAAVAGDLVTDFTKAVNEAIGQANVVLSSSQMLRKKVAIEKMPEALPSATLDSAIASLQSLLERGKGHVPDGVMREAQSKLNDLKRERQIVSLQAGNLGYEKGVERDLATRSSRGITYFRANIPPTVKVVLPARDIAKLEDLASTGINGAKEAISKAIYLVAKRNVEAARKILER